MEQLSRSEKIADFKQPTAQLQPQDSIAAFILLFLYTALVLLRPQEIFTPLVGLPVIMVVMILCTIAGLALQRPLRWAPQQTMLLLLLPVISVSAFLNGWGTKGIIESQNIFISSILPLFLFATVVSSASRQKKLMVVSIIASLAMVHNGWVQQTSYDAFGWTGTQAVARDLRRIVYVGIFQDPNDLGMLLVMNLPFLAYFFHRGGFLTKIICLIIFPIFLYGVYITGSRGTVLGTAALFGFYLLLRYGGTRLIIAGIALGPVVATLLSQFGGLSSDESSARSRLYAWYDGVHYLLNNPVFGIGKGNFTDWHGRAAHNSFILVAAELGTLGYTLWGGALTLTIYVGYKIFKLPLERFANHPQRAMVIDEIKINTALFFSMIAYLVTAFFLSRSYILLLFIFLGMSIASHYRVFKYVPELKSLMSYKMAVYCGMASWVMVFMVYLTLKVSL
ncbi:O-antigen ligase family protein [Alkalimonas collagenimarina]|uniref:O-antigen ligase family protein n=1 Tax=Alkalimonas collagenimarina TaxID=400390 RepID=A0ABT9GZ88_9GAMM|nr:O-antigen ligase family protein [Alkalimonas collagenimarina]MDP4536372.1 O-antigen ligase family protein [Alkalimonas collagenimarina]